MKKVKIFARHNAYELEKDINKFLAEFGGQIQETERLMNISPEKGFVIAIFYLDRK